MSQPPSQQASPDQIQTARELLDKAGLFSPSLRYLSEAVIKSKSEEGITQLITLLQEYLAAKATSYATFKTKLDSILKEEINTRLAQKTQTPS